MMNTHVVIMAGGIGSRFWPMSTPDLPKQFVDIMGVGKTLIQMTVERFSALCPMSNFWVVTGEKYVDLVKEQLPELPHDNILAEPAARNTAPCIAYACWKIKDRHPDANIVVTPSDALVINIEEFRRVISAALDFTEKERRIVTVGIKPSRPETGYGYIETGIQAEGEVLKVNSFREKPCLEVAKQYLENGGYLWNAGIFVWNVDTFINTTKVCMPDIVEQFEHIYNNHHNRDARRNLLYSVYESFPHRSIDLAVLEKADNVYMSLGEFAWSDIESWGLLYDYCKKDKNGNYVGAVKNQLYNCNNNVIIETNPKKLIVADDLKDYLVVDTDDVLLICHRDNEAVFKRYVNDAAIKFGDEFV